MDLRAQRITMRHAISIGSKTWIVRKISQADDCTEPLELRVVADRENEVSVRGRSVVPQAGQQRAGFIGADLIDVGAARSGEPNTTTTESGLACGRQTIRLAVGFRRP